MLPQLTIRLVRHGESTWNADGRVQGQAPGVPLTPLGRRQAQAAAQALRSCRAAAVHSSDLDRALATAAPIAAALGAMVVPEPALREQALGSLEGRLAAELAAQPAPPGVPVTSVRWGGGESMAEVHARVGAFLRRLLAPAGAERVLVTHADAIRAALAWLRGLGPEDIDWAPIPNGSVTTVVLEPAAGRVAGRVRSVQTVTPRQRATGPPFQPGSVAPGSSPQL